MEILQLNEYFKLHLGDSQKILKLYPDNYFDSVVCDPPYHLTSIVKRFGKPGSAPAQFGKDGAFSRASRGFMGKEWDGGDIAFRPEFWAEVYRVLKPGGHLLAFSGSRTYHRMAVGIEDAGFEIRDQIMWLYSGFPKSHDVSKGIDKAAGAVRDKIRIPASGRIGGANTVGGDIKGDSRPWIERAKERGYHELDSDEPATDAARQWQGWGSALKPAHEPIVVARKPLIGTIAENVLTYGTGALNIDGCRVGSEERFNPPTHKSSTVAMGSFENCAGEGTTAIGRWPANVIHDGSEEVTMPLGEAARFFYCAKESKKDREEGLDGRNTHPTVKPTELMRYLCRLVTPPNGIVLDPFMGSGSTGKAAMLEGFRFVGVDMTEEYVGIAEARIQKALNDSNDLLSYRGRKT